MSVEHFDRQYRLKAGVAGAVGFEIGEPTKPYNTALHISFSVERTDSSTLNTTKISIWNLNEEHLNELQRTNCQVELYAGYGNARPLIFRGTITKMNTELDGADRVTEIEAVDGFAEIKDSFTSISFRGRTPATALLEHTARKLGLPIVYSNTAKNSIDKAVLPHGFAYVGQAKNVFTTACNLAGLVWSIQNGTLQVFKVGEPTSPVVHELSARTGLIGIPKKIYNSAVTAGVNTGSTLQDSLFGYEVNYLMNGAIGVNDIVKLESKMVTGIFRVYKLSVSGDNLEGDWLCSAQVVEVGG